jgi:GntR family transcriptional repressor for pyruvate dehydrogenase complex
VEVLVSLSATPVHRPRLLDELTGRILAQIRDEGLRPGDRLPSSRELASRFLVAVPTVREALRRLEATGAVELRHGSGVYVKADVSRLIMVNPNRLALDSGAIVDLLEARELIEPHLAASAARNATDAQLAELTMAFSRTTEALAEDQRLHQANMGFHRTIGRLAGNGALAQVLESLIDLHDQEQRHILDLYGDRDHDHQVHGAILTAVTGRRPEKARRLMTDHLRDVRVVVTAALNPENA